MGDDQCDNVHSNAQHPRRGPDGPAREQHKLSHGRSGGDDQLHGDGDGSFGHHARYGFGDGDGCAHDADRIVDVDSSRTVGDVDLLGAE